MLRWLDFAPALACFGFPGFEFFAFGFLLDRGDDQNAQADNHARCRCRHPGGDSNPGQCPEPEPLGGLHSCAQERNAESDARGVQRHHRRLRLRPGMDLGLRASVLPLRTLLLKSTTSSSTRFGGGQ